MHDGNESAHKVDETLWVQRPHQSKSLSGSFNENDAAARPVGTPSISDFELMSAAGYGLVLLGVKSKVPLETNWNKKRPNNAAVIASAKANSNNVGVILGSGDLVIDVDPRNFKAGDDPLVRLVAEAGIDLSQYARAETGGGGLHIYMRRPEGFDAVGKLDAYPGIDFKTSGQVVAPGSIHPNGTAYVGHELWLLALDMPAPDALLDLLTRGPKLTSNGDLAGELTPSMLAANLAMLDPDEFGSGEYERWITMLMASHHATNGDGLEEFIEWSTRGAGYENAAEVIRHKWNGLDANAQGITVKSLYKAMYDRGLTPLDRQLHEDYFETWNQPCSKNTRWPFITIDELQEMPPPRWLVEGILLEDSIAAIFGAPESFKSFLAVDWAMSIAANRPWHSRSVLPGGVLYIAAEGARGLAKRVRAWKAEHAFDGDLNFHLMRSELNLTNEVDARQFALSVVAELLPLSLIVIDTLNQTAAGADENSAQDMGRYIGSMKLLRELTGATVVVVHHSGKDRDKGPRGSSALPGGFDTIVEVHRPDACGMAINVRVYKQKDEEKDPPMSFVLEKVAESLVLRSTMMADAASEFGPFDPVRDLALELTAERGGRVPLKVLVDILTERTGKSDKTVRRLIEKSFPEGRQHAVLVKNALLWRERMDGNPKGTLEVCSEVAVTL
jgi:hypothetical protein